MSDDGPITRVLKGILGDLQKSAFDDYEDRELVPELEKRVRSEVKLKELPENGIGRTAAMAAQRQIIDSYMMMLLPFCKVISKQQDTRSLNFDKRAAEEIKKNIEKQLKKGSKDLESHSTLISCLALQGKFKDAEKEVKNLTSNNPDYGMGWHMYGALLWLFGRLDEADVALEKAAKLLPEEKMIPKSLVALRVMMIRK
ncbi:MAG: hypothetical protein C4K48_05490 [Candidatus Thorarchaeota archaeon]|nr:MAG: hypothetical protein C4K48_05490 [Candidatus Thorarchaeota archaeon]